MYFLSPTSPMLMIWKLLAVRPFYIRITLIRVFGGAIRVKVTIIIPEQSGQHGQIIFIKVTTLHD
ncbi:MAG: hypothetical protein B1H02_00345 [Candidatus Latescibacteria bacterium 4484_107]|nr:MAG: hypothetical protein B1H02_00345 [Candidatus Latescibacteria bacterium 4484_107]